MIVDLWCILETSTHFLEFPKLVLPLYLCTGHFIYLLGCKILGGMVWEKSSGSPGLVSIDTFLCCRVGTLVHVDVMKNFMLVDQFFYKLLDGGAVLHLMGEKDT